MTKTMVIKEVASKIEGMTQKDVKEVLDALQVVVFDAVKAQDEVAIIDGVKLYGKYVESREARNPLTGATVMTKAKVAPKAKFGKAIKDYVAE